MTYHRFEDVPGWREAINLGQRIDAFTRQAPFQQQRSLRDQIERAAVSVSNNIIEGFERGTTQELIPFLYYARGSAGEVRLMLWLMEGLPSFANSKSEILNLRSLSESCARQLRAWADSLQNSPLKGQRHLTEASRRRKQAAKRAAAFQQKLKSMVPPRGSSAI